MTRKFRCTVEGDCPYTGTLQAIEINYFEVPMSGTLGMDYKKDAYSCALSDECPYPERDKYHRCPVYINAPSRPC
ncbi:MAG: hypothetical protein RR639_04200 [Hydrogenoanaerobacterium sp.]